MKTNNKGRKYRTIAGRTIDLGPQGLSRDERRCLGTVLEKYRAGLDWTRFASFWMKEIAKHQLARESRVFRICQDLEARLGIAQGKAAPPDYREYLAALIEERFGSRYKFCKETGIDEGQLSRIFAGRGDLSLESLLKALSVLHAALIVQSEEELRENANPEEASHLLEAALR